ncbi:MAG: IS4 family transposase [Deltaproteobacteria bacterium]|jgi:uncharacterized pyridoxamine 5'-phosphate oxidase family protein|nr:IS4 family transposase [Deltaproteobacteria bacterium]
MSRDQKSLADQVDFTHLMTIGYFAKILPRSLIDQVLALTGRDSMRIRLFPAPEVVYFLMFMAINRRPSLEEIVRIFNQSIQKLSWAPQNCPRPNKSAISQARTRLGSEPIRLMADQVLRPMAWPDYPGAWYKGQRLMSMDETSFDLPDQQENAAYFGYPEAPKGQAVLPQVKVLALVETATRTITAAEMGPCSLDSRDFTEKLLQRKKISANMLWLADWNHVGDGLLSKALALKAKVICSVQAEINYQHIKDLPDGSILATIYDPASNHGSVYVRVIKHKPEKPGPENQKKPYEKYPLLTNFLNHEQAPAHELSALYYENHKIDSLYGEFKKSSRGARTILRSKKPDLVLQELWALLLAHFALKDLMTEFSWLKKTSP